MSMRPVRRQWRHDGDLVRSIVEERDQLALAEFARRHAPSIDGPLYVILNDDRESMSEARQDVLLTVWNRVGSCTGNIDGWLRTVARNAALDIVRRRQRQPRTAQLDDIADESAAPDSLVGDQVTLRCALDKLSPRERLLVEMKYIEQLHDRDIAAALFLSAESVRQSLSRARRSLVAAFGRCSE